MPCCSHYCIGTNVSVVRYDLQPAILDLRPDLHAATSSDSLARDRDADARGMSSRVECPSEERNMKRSHRASSSPSRTARSCFVIASAGFWHFSRINCTTTLCVVTLPLEDNVFRARRYGRQHASYFA